MFSVVPVFVAEISHKDIRGTLGTQLIFGNNTGVLISFVVGHWLPYGQRAPVLIAFPILFVLAFARFPETPAFLWRQGRHAEARAAMRFYRNDSVDAAEPDMGEAMQETAEDMIKQKENETDSTSIAWRVFSMFYL